MKQADPFTTDFGAFRHPDLHYTVSVRLIEADVTIRAYLQSFFPYIDRSQIESVFGFVDTRAPLYGGRVYQQERALHAGHRTELLAYGIHLSLPMTNHFFDRAAYEASRPVLAAHHRAGNSVILMGDEFAYQVRQDFPLYRRKASVIRRLLTPRSVDQALELYDQVVLPMESNSDFELLRTLGPKERIQIFANASCAYTCPAKICYPSISRINRGEIGPDGFRCSGLESGRKHPGTVFFDVRRYAELGYRSFKLVPVAQAQRSAATLAKWLTKMHQAPPGDPVTFAESGFFRSVGDESEK